jgi:hypothetical protein
MVSRGSDLFLVILEIIWKLSAEGESASDGDIEY